MLYFANLFKTLNLLCIASAYNYYVSKDQNRDIAYMLYLSFNLIIIGRALKTRLEVMNLTLTEI